jgi:hypothetical protein
VAATHSLTQEQQRDLILSHIPSSEPEYAYINLEPTLKGVFSIVSTMASKIMTIAEIQKQINMWSLNNQSDITLYKSVTTLVDLVRRSMEHTDGGSVSNPELFKQVITRIQRDNIPESLKEALNLARCRIRGDETVPELNDNLLGTLNKYIGHSKKSKSQSSVPQTNKATLGNQDCSPPQVFAIEYQQPKVAQVPNNPPQQNQGNNGGAKSKGYNNKKGNNGNQKSNQQSPQNTAGNKAHDGEGQNNKKGPFKKHRFVKPWDPKEVYLSKNGNQLSQKCQKHFEGHCWKCGHSSHTYEKCKIYPDTTTFLSLCSTCNQGFHDQCKRRWAWEKTVADQLKQITVMYNHLAADPPRQAFMITNQSQGQVQEPDDSD